MPSFRDYDPATPAGKLRREKIDRVLPKEPLITPLLDVSKLTNVKRKMMEILLAEIEIYKEYPKRGQYVTETFDTRNNNTCFMGQGFKMNGAGFEGWEDSDLREYRNRIGTLPHGEWGGCTMLEIWGADHFEKYPDMVKGVADYAFGLRPALPAIQFHINPLFKNAKSGKQKPTDEQKAEKAYGQHLVKCADFVEIRRRLKAAGIPLSRVRGWEELAVDEKDDPKPPKRRRG